MKVEELVKKGALAREKPDLALIKKELDEAENDLLDAERSFRLRNYKWAIVQSYYAMFHAAKAVLFSKGLREKKHFAISAVLELLSKEGLLEDRFVHDFAAVQYSRAGRLSLQPQHGSSRQCCFYSAGIC